MIVFEKFHNVLCNAVNIFPATLTNPKRWDNLADSILSFAMFTALTAAFFWIFGYTTIETFTLSALAFTVGLIFIGLGIKEFNDSSKYNDTESNTKKKIFSFLFLYFLFGSLLYSLECNILISYFHININAVTWIKKIGWVLFGSILLKRIYYTLQFIFNSKNIHKIKNERNITLKKDNNHPTIQKKYSKLLEIEFVLKINLEAFLKYMLIINIIISSGIILIFILI